MAKKKKIKELADADRNTAEGRMVWTLMAMISTTEKYKHLTTEEIFKIANQPMKN